METDGDQLYLVHNGPVHTWDNDLKTFGFGSQNRPLSRNSNRNGSGQGCQFTPTVTYGLKWIWNSSCNIEPLWSRTYWSHQFSSIPSVCGVSYYNQFIVQFSVYVHDIPFMGINRSTVSERCWILEVAPMDSRGGPHHRECDVALCSAWHFVQRIISVTEISGVFSCPRFSISKVISHKAVTMIYVL